jgi:hypothetical protein
MNFSSTYVVFSWINFEFTAKEAHGHASAQLTTFSSDLMENIQCFIRFEVFTAVTMKNGVFWDVTLCGSCKNGRF